MIFLLVFLIHGVISASNNCSWNKCNEWKKDADVINVHLVPHTHDDLGWIKTVDQYYYGARPDLVPVGVQYIYNTVIQELLKDPSRRFSFAETGFLNRWTTSHGDHDRHMLQKLVKNGQIELIGGGWVQNDEAASHYVDIISQMEFGLKKLDYMFGECGHAQAAWQIDPFGHSREVANLFAMMGYSSLYFARIHYLEKEARLANKSLDFVWDTSDDLKTNIFTSAFFKDDYNPPDGFCFDVLCGDDPIMDNEDLEGYNVQDKVSRFVAFAKKQAAAMRTNHIMMLMGSDFQYTNANMWFDNLDKLIRYVNGNSSAKVNVFYSTPACYYNAINETAPRLTRKFDDFFPYASKNHSFWTGYFTSRPTFKRIIREASALLQFANSLDVVGFLGDEDESDIDVLRKASSLVQHHDAVTGTARQEVTYDYIKQLSRGMDEVDIVINDYFARFAAKGASGAPAPPRQFRCPLLNETACAGLSTLESFSVTIHNPRAQELNEIFAVPCYFKNPVVFDNKGNKVTAQLSKTPQNQLTTNNARAPYRLSIPVVVSSFGFTTYFVQNSTSTRATRLSSKTKPDMKPDADPTFIENNLIKVQFDSAGYVQSVVDKVGGKTYPLKQQFFYYQGVARHEDDQTSGAYIFRPTTTTPFNIDGQMRIEVSKGDLVQEVHQYVNPWISQTIRITNNSADIEFAWTVGPIPYQDNITKEIVTRYITSIHSDDVFYTDANGRQLMQRRRNKSPTYTYADTEPVAGNYYPITSSIVIRDDSQQLSVLTDRSEGATSSNGLIEVMLHRRCLYDDYFGVGEPLNETGVDGTGLIATGVHVVQLGALKNAARRHRVGQLRVFQQPVAAFADVADIVSYQKNFTTAFAGLKHALPEHISILTLSKWHAAEVLLRLEHVLQNGEDDELSVPIPVNLQGLFSTFEVTAFREVMLAGIREPPSPTPSEGFVVTLQPMEIRTFILTVTVTNHPEP